MVDSLKRRNELAQGFKQSVDFFDRVQALAWYGLMLDDFIRFARFKPADRVLDAGCGPGALTRKIARRVNEAVGIDSSPPMVDKARQSAEVKKLKNLSFAVGRVDEIPFDDYSFDVVADTSAVYLLDKPLVGLNEMTRVTKAGGELVLLVPSVEMRPERLRSYVAKKSLTGFAFEALYDWLGAAEANNRFSVTEIERLCQKAGLTRTVVAEELDRMVLFVKALKAH
jgi:ubiquinone/menaquinone biosynthesis C-methylase UbiE